MVPGLNSTVSHAGVEYHVQTEDLGDKDPCILTLVYRAGAIVAREKLDYRDIPGGSASAARLKELLETQHQRAVARASAGAFDLPERQPPAPRVNASGPATLHSTPELDQRIAEYVRKRTAARRR